MKAISNTDFHQIQTVHLDVKLRTVNLDVKQRTEKVENLILLRLKTVPGACPWKYIREGCKKKGPFS